MICIPKLCVDAVNIGSKAEMLRVKKIILRRGEKSGGAYPVSDIGRNIQLALHRCEKSIFLVKRAAFIAPYAGKSDSHGVKKRGQV
jgi:hypothetical protein